MPTVVCCLLLLLSGAPGVRAAEKGPVAEKKVAAGNVAGTAHEEDVVTLSFGKVRLKSAIYLFSHMSAFNIAYDPDLIPDVRVSVDAKDRPWKALIEDVLSKHDLTLMKHGTEGYKVIPAAPAPSETHGGEPHVDWEGARRKHVRLRQIISQGDRHAAILDSFGLVESGSTISAAFGPHVYTWRVKVSADSIALRRHIVEECLPVASLETGGTASPSKDAKQAAAAKPATTPLPNGNAAAHADKP